MSYKIIIDSCGELTDDMKASGRFSNVPLGLSVGDYHIMDDENFDQLDFIKRVDESPVGPMSTCPSPEAYLNSYLGDEERVYVVTLSSQLSGSYNSAVLAKNLYIEEYGENKKIHVVDSKSASVGETLIGRTIYECEEKGMDYDAVVSEAESYRDKINTFFVLESLETLRKNGRLSNLKAFVASKLNIKPVMGSTDEGTIQQLDQGRGMNKALDKMVEHIVKATPDCKNRILGLSHCNNEERAKLVKEKLEKVAEFKDIIILNTRGVSTMYANQGGIIIAV
ncbi:MAG: DegV family protein [Eubacterium sp.]|nr:DegV family protein [Eubacterium sp.]